MISGLKTGARRVAPALYEKLRSDYKGEEYNPPVGHARLGDLRRLTPFCIHWGALRGLPVDRYYIENFLDRHRADIRGRVLEVGDPTYTRRFGGEHVERSDVLHVDADAPEATIISDLESGEGIPSAAFDCIILTQTLQLIFNVPAAIQTIQRILRPGGVLLCTVPGITKTGDKDWGSTWYWSFTALSVQRMFEAQFGRERVEVKAHGNVLTAAAFLYGLACEELTPEELNHRDPAYEVLITARVVSA